jgi:carbonic anhydrase
MLYPLSSLPCLLLALALASCTSPGSVHKLNTTVAPADALVLLKAGNERHVSGHHARQDNPTSRRATLAKGQKPFAVILACADSRTGPEIIFDQQLGSLFVCRVAGNVTDPVVLGSIEYAVEHLDSPLIVVLGHSKCGAVGAALEGGHAEGNIGALLHHVHTGSSLPTDPAAKSDAGVANNTRHQMKNLTSQSAVIRKLVKEGKVAIAGGVFSLETGEVKWF